VEKPSKLMCLFMLILAGKTEDNTLIKSVYRDLLSIHRLKFSKLTTTILLKSFCLFGEVQILLECYERLYQYGHLPEKIHWQCLLKGAARSGDPKNFTRFYSRLVKKGLQPSKEMLKHLLDEWGSNENMAWKLSKECNCHVHDYVYVVDFAQRVHNYKRALQFVQDVYHLKVQPTYQLYVMFMRGVSRDYPKFRYQIRDWKLRFASKYGFVDKATVLDFEAWMSTVREHIGEENLINAPVGPTIPHPKLRVTRNEIATQYGYKPPKQRYTSQYTDDSKLFQFVPEYALRLEREAKEKERDREKERIQKEIAIELERAQQKEREWRRVGFKGDASVADEELDNELKTFRTVKPTKDKPTDDKDEPTDDKDEPTDDEPTYDEVNPNVRKR